jgi:hypothetical protein
MARIIYYLLAISLSLRICQVDDLPHKYFTFCAAPDFLSKGHFLGKATTTYCCIMAHARWLAIRLYGF